VGAQVLVAKQSSVLSTERRQNKMIHCPGAFALHVVEILP
jgi:hypothetical protein